MFPTAFYADTHARRRVLRYASAGHPPPRLRRRNNTVEELGGVRGLPLGVLEDQSWTEHEVRLVPGEALLLYTDGILEGTNAAGEAFGLERLDAALRLSRLRAGPMVAHVERHFKDFCNGAPDH